MSSAEKVQEFLDEEHAETSFDSARYGKLYNQRCIATLNVQELRELSEESSNTPQTLLAAHSAMYPQDVKDFADRFQRHLEETQMLGAIKAGWFRPPKGRFQLRGEKMPVRKAASKLAKVKEDLTTDEDWLEQFDARVFVTYFELAWQLDRKWAEELCQRYRFHYVIQGMWKLLQGHKFAMNYMLKVLDDAATERQVDIALVERLRGVFLDSHTALQLVLNESELTKFPELANMPAGKSICDFLFEGSLMERPLEFNVFVPDRWFRKFGKWLRRFGNQFGAVDKRLNRLHFKSLGNILALQERIGEEAEKKWPLPTVEAVDDPIPTVESVDEPAD